MQCLFCGGLATVASLFPRDGDVVAGRACRRCAQVATRGADGEGCVRCGTAATYELEFDARKGGAGGGGLAVLARPVAVLCETHLLEATGGRDFFGD